MKKRLASRLLSTGFAALLLALLLLPAPAFAEEEGDAENETRQAIAGEILRLSGETDLSAWQSYFEALCALSPSAGNYRSINAFVAALAGGEDAPGLDSVVLELFLPGLRSTLRRMLGVILAAMLAGVAGVLLEDGGAKKTVLLALASAAVLPAAALFAELAGTASAVIRDIAAFSELSSPILGALLTVLGCTGSAAFLAPKLAFIAEGVVLLLSGAVLPMLLASGVLTAMNALGGMRFDRTVRLLQKTAKWLLAFAAAVYTAAAVTGGVRAGAADGVSIRAARFAVDRLIPSAGGLISGAADVVRAGSLLVKNAAGTAAILLLAALAIRPVISLAGGMLALRIAAAAAEPLSDDRIPKLLDELADTVSLLLGAAASAAAMFTVTVVMIICCGSAVFG